MATAPGRIGKVPGQRGRGDRGLEGCGSKCKQAGGPSARVELEDRQGGPMERGIKILALPSGPGCVEEFRWGKRRVDANAGNGQPRVLRALPLSPLRRTHEAEAEVTAACWSARRVLSYVLPSVSTTRPSPDCTDGRPAASGLNHSEVPSINDPSNPGCRLHPPARLMGCGKRTPAMSLADGAANGKRPWETVCLHVQLGWKQFASNLAHRGEGGGW